MPINCYFAIVNSILLIKNRVYDAVFRFFCSDFSHCLYAHCSKSSLCSVMLLFFEQINDDVDDNDMMMMMNEDMAIWHIYQSDNQPEHI